MAIFLKDPQAVIDYAVDWSAGYLAGQTIAASDWAIEPAGELAVAAPEIEPGRTLATFSGGVAGCVYRVTNRVTFSDARTDERTLVLRVENR